MAGDGLVHRPGAGPLESDLRTWRRPPVRTPEEAAAIAAEHLRLAAWFARGRLVRRLWRACGRPHVDYRDLRHELYLALVRAALSWTEDLGRFSNYAMLPLGSAARSVYVRALTDRRLRRRIWETRPCNPAEDVLGENKEFVHAVLKTLPARERLVVRHYYGLGLERLENPEIAAMLGVSPERARQLREEALGKLRRAAARVGVREI